MPEGGCRPIEITDPADERLAPYRSLRAAASEAGGRRGRPVFVAEGRLAIEQLVASSYPIVSVVVTPNKLETLRPLLDAVDRRGAPVYVAARNVLAETAGFDVHRGLMGAGRAGAAVDPAALIGRGDLLVAEGVNDHENLGALFRNARAFGSTAVLLDPTCADPLYRRSIRVSLGHVLRLPFARLAPWPDRLGDLRDRGYLIVALTPDPQALTLDAVAAARVDGRGHRRPVALMVGSEGTGLSPAARLAAEVEARVSMADGVDSLNVATAAAVAMHCMRSPGVV